MASILAVRQGLVERLETIDGLRVHQYVTGTVSPPAATIVPGLGSETSTSRPAIEYDKSFGGSVLMNFMVKVAVSPTADDAGQARLDTYLDTRSDTSIKDALEADMDPIEQDGDIIADSVLVTGVAHYGMIEWGGIPYLGADLHVEVQAR
jgi:hypothetical protein